MRDALPVDVLKKVYARLAGHYDIQHGLITFGSDQRGRRLLVRAAVSPGVQVLDCGCGTGTTGVMAARRVGEQGHVTFFDLSDDMLGVARQKIKVAGLDARASFETGDLLHLPFPDRAFDIVLSTYSLCPVYDPAEGALELYRVLKPGGKLGIAHSAEPHGPLMKWLGEKIDGLAWHFPWLSMGCRPVSVLPALEGAGARLLFSRRLGVPVYPFFVFVVEKPAA